MSESNWRSVHASLPALEKEAAYLLFIQEEQRRCLGLLKSQLQFNLDSYAISDFSVYSELFGDRTFGPRVKQDFTEISARELTVRV
jgi:hypothetical protein